MNDTSFTTELPTPPYAATLPAMLAHIAGFGSVPAVIADDGAISYADLERDSLALASGLLRAGVTKGSRVGLLMGNSIGWITSFLAITRLGAVAVPLSTFYQAPELAWVVRHADLQVLICVDHHLKHDYVSRLEAALPGLSGSTGELHLAAAPFLRRIFIRSAAPPAWAGAWSDLRDDGADPGSPFPALAREIGPTISPADLAVIVYTSGSTADPKGVTHTHGKLVRHTFGLGAVAWPFAAGDRVGTTRPFFWIAGLAATVLYALQVGACLICKSVQTGGEVLQRIREDGLTALVGREPWLQGLENDPVLLSSSFRILSLGYGCSAVAQVASGSLHFVNGRVEARRPAGWGALAPERAARSIGMTETIGSETQELAFSSLPDGREGSCGRAVPGMTLKVVAPDGTAVGPGVVGELLVRGGPLTDGLYKRERSETFTEDGFYPTGDLCSLDADGFVFFEARRSEMLKIRGANVAPAEVERCLTDSGHVVEAAVVEVVVGGDPMVAAAVVRAPGSTISEDDLIAHLRGRLSSFKVPKRIAFFDPDALPRTGSAKPKKPDIQALLTTQLNAPPAGR